MFNLQKLFRRLFLKFLFLFIFFIQNFFVPTVSGSRTIFDQDLTKTSLKSAAATPDTNLRADFSAPFKKCWELFDNKLLANNLASDNINDLFTSSLNGRISLLDTNSGRKQWESDLGGEIISVPSVEERNIFVLTRLSPDVIESDVNDKSKGINTETLTIRSLNRENGVTEWQTKIPKLNFSKSDKSEFDSGTETESWFLHIFESSLLVFSVNGVILSFDKSDGKLLWSKEQESVLSTSPFYSGDTAIFGTREGLIFFVSLRNGTVLKKIDTADQQTATVYYNQENRLVLGNRKSGIYSFDLRRTETETRTKQANKIKNAEWQFRNGAEISGIKPTLEGLLISSLDNFVYLISENSGKLLWKRRLDGRISAQPAITDKYAVITTVSEPIASIIDLRNGKLINEIILADDNFFINSPLIIADKLILTTQHGISAYSTADCSEK